jgi:hypothetical protein
MSDADQRPQIPEEEEKEEHFTAAEFELMDILREARHQPNLV